MQKPKVSSEAKTAPETPKEPFDLPRAIARQLRKCAMEHDAGSTAPTGHIEYLWISLSPTATSAKHGPVMNGHALSQEEWLNIVDEAAGMGVAWLFICVGRTLKDQPDLWPICQWAQNVHGLNVGIHIDNETPVLINAKALAELDPAKTFFFVDGEPSGDVEAIRSLGIAICSTVLEEDDHPLPCSLPESMLFVAPSGRAYSCGLVMGHKDFCFGSVMDKCMSEVIEDEALPRVIDRRYEGCTCGACPPIMAKRASEAKKKLRGTGRKKISSRAAKR